MTPTPNHSSAAVTCLACHQPTNITLRGYCPGCWLIPADSPEPARAQSKPSQVRKPRPGAHG